MDRQQAKRLIKETFESRFDRERFRIFIRNLLNQMEEDPFVLTGNMIPDAFEDYVGKFERIGKYHDGDHRIDVLVVQLRRGSSVERARSTQRRFIAGYLKGN